MTTPSRKKYSRGFSFVIALFTFIYPVGVILMPFAWFGVQSLDLFTLAQTFKTEYATSSRSAAE
jgi:hypothetical protein